MPGRKISSPPEDSRAGGERRRFATTCWRLVSDASADSAAGRQALEQLCSAYWFPLYAFLRGSGDPPEDAQDLVQEFLAHALEKRLFQSADPVQGRLRTFLLASLQNFRKNHRRDAHALKRGGDIRFVSLDLTTAEGQLAEASHLDLETPERAYERAWAMALVQQVLTRLRAEQAADGLGERFDILAPRLFTLDPQAPYAQLAARLQMQEGAVKTAMHRLRRRCWILIRLEVAMLVPDETEVEDELRHLAAVLAR